MKSILDEILETMRDTEDPKVGSVFEKEVKTDIADFDVFMKVVYPGSVGTTSNDNGVFLIMYHNAGKGHVGTYNFSERTGWFGGSRIGSENPWLKPGTPLVNNPFHLTRKDKE